MCVCLSVCVFVCVCVYGEGRKGGLSGYVCLCECAYCLCVSVLMSLRLCVSRGMEELR